MSSKFMSQQVSPPKLRMLAIQVDHLVVCLLRCPSVCMKAMPELDSAHFSQEPHYRLLWEVLKDLSEKYGIGHVSYEAMYATLAERMAAMPGLLPEASVARLLADPGDVERGDAEAAGILYHAYHEAKDTDEKLGIEYLKRFLEERAVIDRASAVLNKSGVEVPGDFENVLSELQAKHMRVQAIERPMAFFADDFGFNFTPVQTFPTGLPVLDFYLDGGQAPGELYSYFGPFKSGKSFTAGDICCSAAEQFFLQHSNGEPFRAAYYAFYEMNRDADVKNRMWSRGAEISLNRLTKDVTDVAQLSRVGELLPYEKAMYKARGLYNYDDLPGEYERLQSFSQGAGRHYGLLDMTGYDQSHPGSGGVAELAAILQNLTAVGKPPGLLVIDYVHLMTARYLEARGLDPGRDMRPQLKKSMRDLISLIAKPFNIPVWVLGQYSAEGQNMSPTKVPDSTFAGEAKTLHENVAFSICAGAVDQDSGVGITVCDVARRGPNMGKVRLAKLDYEFGRVRDVTEHYDINKGTGMISPKDQAHSSAHQVDAKAVADFKAQPKSDPYKASKEAAAPPPPPPSQPKAPKAPKAAKSPKAEPVAPAPGGVNLLDY